MKPDQERVRNLLTDTVTLLCKNGLIFKEELRIEGLLGVTVDNKESFYVHIGDTFGPSGDKLDRDPVTGDTMKEKEKERPKKKYRGDDSPSHPGASPKSTPSRPSSVSSVSAASSPAQFKVKSEPEDDVSTTDSKGWKRGLQGNDGEPPTKRRLGDSGGNSGDGMGFGLGHGHGHGQMMAGHNNQNPWQDLAAQVSTGPQLGSADIQMAIDSLPGTSQWSSPGGSGGGGAQASSDMGSTVFSAMLSAGDGKEAQYPNSYITSSSQKDDLRKHLVEPLHGMGFFGVAIRIVWRDKDRFTNDNHWKRICASRSKFDDLLKQMNLPLFVSSISGTFTKSNKVAPVYPACAYWIMTQNSQFLGQEVIKCLTREAVPDRAEVRYLSSPNMVKVEEMASSLCTVLKDHNSAYVKRRMMESQQALGLTDAQVGTAGRIVMTSPTPSLSQHITMVIPPLNNNKIYLDVIKE